ncbi:rho GTPase-activating protein 19 isoform X2 [Stigmatopora argus]
MAAGKEGNVESTPNTRHSNMVGRHDHFSGGPQTAAHPPVIFNPDFFVEKLRHEHADVFLELVLSNISRLIDLPGVEFSQLLGEDGPKTPGFFRSFNFLKRKDKSTMFGPALSDSVVAQIYRLIEYLSKNLHVEGLFRIPGNSMRQHALKDLLTSGVNVDLDSRGFHPHDAASLLKSFLGELPEPLLTHRHFHAHLKIADMMLLDEHGNKTPVPNKERQMEALQLLLLLLPPTNRSLLRVLLDLLYHTAKQQDANKMSAFNLALMFAPHVLWPRHMTANDLKDHLKTLNNSMTFLIRYSQKLFRAPVYLRERCRAHLMKITTMRSKDDLDLLSLSDSPKRQVASPLKRQVASPLKRQVASPLKRQVASPLKGRVVPARIKGPVEQCQSPVQQYTDEALKDLFRHVQHNMPDSAKKKKLVRQLVKQTAEASATSQHDVPSQKRPRSRSFGGLIKRKARADQMTPDSVTRVVHKRGNENVVI